MADNSDKKDNETLSGTFKGVTLVLYAPDEPAQEAAKAVREFVEARGGNIAIRNQHPGFTRESGFH